MSIQASFAQPVADAQCAFRRILKAVSEPGVMVTLLLQQGWGRLSPASTAVMLTLVDRDTPLWLDDALDDESLRSNLRFHTGAILTRDESAAFALLHVSSAIALSRFSAGDVMSPEKSTTAIIEISGLTGGTPLRLSGPGLETSRVVEPQLPPDMLRYLCHRPDPFPQGIDLMFTCADALMALPRTTHVEVC
ncbi:carbon-phosphorus lyase complex subunit [Pectobacterium brasiliense]|uniref:phosphonate C-P lyase system protein PhnH n=1 Tax=Pectobacterium brasiliense TaxID=180957 RepID=UPI00057E56B9|nr:phosphonate C-P lyase system protein PhnH [Pectobacterium brasiliense]KHS87980.1 carbon-phosphorus lyase complex subunit [Pectobacterium brasiliense]KHT03121.1 carbon-phosphorus lyase complex subunit [Pectobacterium brasiliense]MBN3102061.1 phosphonate C-P lyase system protein PhnH [Pectobacterium brasiliense]